MAKYGYLHAPDVPRMISEGVRLLGVVEAPGSTNNPTILGWAGEIERALRTQGLAHRTLGYTSDSIPWCGLFVGVVAVRAGWTKQMPTTPLWARAWLGFGQVATIPSLGDVLVFKRDGGGHVGLYVGEDMVAYHVLGGNQSDKVSIARVEKSRLLGARRPEWRFAQPKSVKRIKLTASGALSKNEA